MEPLNILLVDNNVNFLKHACSYLAQHSTVHIVGTAQSGEGSVEQAEILNPDIVFMDILISGMSGFEAARRIKEAKPSPHVVMLTLHDSIDLRCHATAVGVDAFLQKDRFDEEILGIIEALTENRKIQLQETSKCCGAKCGDQYSYRKRAWTAETR